MEKFNDGKNNLMEAIELLNKNIQEKKPPVMVVFKKLEDRMKYISKKASNCRGYSDAEKKARYDEILNTMEIIKEIFNVDI